MDESPAYSTVKAAAIGGQRYIQIGAGYFGRFIKTSRDAASRMQQVEKLGSQKARNEYYR